MRVLVACEFSGIVREAFSAQGHDAVSCDLLPSEINGPHYQGDVRNLLNDEWDLMVAHPSCRYLAVSGARWMRGRQAEQSQALEFVRLLLNAPIQKIALENPVSIISTQIRKPDQIIQPWQFGHPETKRTCLWLKGLPLLKPTNIVEPEYMERQGGGLLLNKRGYRYSKVNYGSRMAGNRGIIRSRTYEGIANAMAAQWS